MRPKNKKRTLANLRGKRKLHLLRGQKAPPKRYRYASSPPRIRGLGPVFALVQGRIEFRHIVIVRKHGGKCPLWALLRELTGLPWRVQLVCDLSGSLVRLKCRWKGGHILYEIRANSEQGRTLYDFLFEFWEPSYDVVPIEAWMHDFRNPVCVGLKECPVKPRKAGAHLLKNPLSTDPELENRFDCEEWLWEEWSRNHTRKNG